MPEITTDDGVRIVYDDLGPREGVPVVLCHGLAAAGEQLLADAQYFAGLGYRVLVPDLRGHGRSAKPATMSRDTFAIARMAEDQVEMLDHAGLDAVHWVGNSLGGIVALHLLHDHAQRFRTLTTFGTAYALHLPAWTGDIIPNGYKLLGANLAAKLMAWGTTKNKAARPIIDKLIRQFDPEVGSLISKNLAHYDYIEDAASVDVPILLLRCGLDRPINRELGPTLKALDGKPHFTTGSFPNAGHCANLDDPEGFRAAVRKFIEAN
jgi:pimeloyl-ACP methyl ester carboxylesterase